MKVPSISRLFNAAAVAAVCGACSSAMMKNSVASATAVMYNASGGEMGTAQIWQSKDGVVFVEIPNILLSAGTHGIHFHDVGKCDGSTTPPFSTAGGHYNPMGKQHGLQNPAGPHAGDNPNIIIPPLPIGGRISFSTKRVSLTPGTASLLDADGSSLVIHASADDQVSNPAGNSGARIACGVVKALP